MRHECQARSPCFWLRLEWRFLIGVERWAFSHHRRGPILGRIVALLDRAYNRQTHVTKMPPGASRRQDTTGRTDLEPGP